MDVWKEMGQAWGRTCRARPSLPQQRALVATFVAQCVPRFGASGIMLLFEMGVGKTLIQLLALLVNRTPVGHVRPSTALAYAKTLALWMGWSRVVSATPVHRRIRRTLLVAATTVQSSWLENVTRHFAPHTIPIASLPTPADASALFASDRGAVERLLGSSEGDANTPAIVMTTYATLAILHAEWQKAQKTNTSVEAIEAAQPMLRIFARTWDCVILDEAHEIRTASSQASTAARTLNALTRHCVTGSAINNSLSDLTVLFHTMRLKHPVIERHAACGFDRSVAKRVQAGVTLPFCASACDGMALFREHETPVAEAAPFEADPARMLVSIAGVPAEQWRTALLQHDRPWEIAQCVREQCVGPVALTPLGYPSLETGVEEQIFGANDVHDDNVDQNAWMEYARWDSVERLVLRYLLAGRHGWTVDATPLLLGFLAFSGIDANTTLAGDTAALAMIGAISANPCTWVVHHVAKARILLDAYVRHVKQVQAHVRAWLAGFMETCGTMPIAKASPPPPPRKRPRPPAMTPLLRRLVRKAAPPPPIIPPPEPSPTREDDGDNNNNTNNNTNNDDAPIPGVPGIVHFSITDEDDANARACRLAFEQCMQCAVSETTIEHASWTQDARRALQGEILAALTFSQEASLHPEVVAAHRLDEALALLTRRRSSATVDAAVFQRAITYYQALPKVHTPATAHKRHVTPMMRFYKRYIETNVREGEKIVLFGRFTAWLEILRGYLTDVLHIGCRMYEATGDADARNAAIASFAASSTEKVLLVTTRGNAMGINLACANHALLADPWYNPRLDDQALARIYRPGQMRYAIRAIVTTRGSYSHAMYVLGAEKALLGYHVSGLGSQRRRQLDVDAETQPIDMATLRARVEAGEMRTASAADVDLTRDFSIRRRTEAMADERRNAPVATATATTATTTGWAERMRLCDPCPWTLVDIPTLHDDDTEENDDASNVYVLAAIARHSVF